MQQDRVVGVCTFGSYGDATGKSLAFAFVATDLIEVLQVVVAGARRKQTLLDAAAWDHTNAIQKG
jgi:dimethylglycine dehydrogenase